MQAPEPIIALDLSNADRMFDTVRRTFDLVPCYKVGPLGLLYHGHDYLNIIKSFGSKIFLDLKVHEIPKTLYGVIDWADDFGIEFLTVTFLPGITNLKLPKDRRTKLLAVIELTSSPTLNPEIFGEWLDSVQECEFDGVVCPFPAIRWVKDKYPNLITVTPGLRLELVRDEHNFVFTPREIALTGGNYFVLGKPIVSSNEPRETMLSIQHTITSTLGHHPTLKLLPGGKEVKQDA